MVDCYWTTPLLVIVGMGDFQWGEREELTKKGFEETFEKTQWRKVK